MKLRFPMQPQPAPEKLSYCDSMLGACPCKTRRDRFCSISFRRRTLSTVVLSQRPTETCWDSQVSRHQLQQTLVHQHLSRKFSIHCSTRLFQNPGALLMKFSQHRGDAVELPKQAPARFLSRTKCYSSGCFIQLE